MGKGAENQGGSSSGTSWADITVYTIGEPTRKKPKKEAKKGEHSEKSQEKGTLKTGRLGQLIVD